MNIFGYSWNNCVLGDLTKYLKEKNLDIVGKLKIMSECASALSFMHNLRSPVIHRDIKQKNVLMLEWVKRLLQK